MTSSCSFTRSHETGVEKPYCRVIGEESSYTQWLHVDIAVEAEHRKWVQLVALLCPVGQM